MKHFVHFACANSKAVQTVENVTSAQLFLKVPPTELFDFNVAVTTITSSFLIGWIEEFKLIAFNVSHDV